MVVKNAHAYFRYREQTILFDFNPTTFGIHMAVDEETTQANGGQTRYKQIAVPQWFNVDLTPPDFLASPYINNL